MLLDYAITKKKTRNKLVKHHNMYQDQANYRSSASHVMDNNKKRVKEEKQLLNTENKLSHAENKYKMRDASRQLI